MKNIKEIILKYLDEKFEVVMRKGKPVKKRICPDGFKLVNKKCVKMGAIEKIHRAKAMKKAAVKRKGKMSKTLKKREKSMKKREKLSSLFNKKGEE